MSIVIKARAYEMIKEAIEWAEDASEVRLRHSEARCICKWSEQFDITGDEDDVHAASRLRFELHVASGDCPEERDDDGNVISGIQPPRGNISMWGK